MSVRLNCWLVAMWLWIMSRGKSYAWIRRSHGFLGLLPHFGQAERSGFRTFRSIEYRPPKRKLFSSDDMLIAFVGYYLVVHYKAVSIRRWTTKEQALADHYFPKVNGQDGQLVQHTSSGKKNFL